MARPWEKILTHRYAHAPGRRAQFFGGNCSGTPAICAACHHTQPRDHLSAVAGPTGTAWFCVDTEACMRRAGVGR